MALLPRKDKELPRPFQEKRTKLQWAKLISLWVGGVFVLLAVAGIIFIKVNTSAAADFTDNVLRPLLGNDRTVALERIFFNASDSVQQLEYKNKTPDAPQFVQADGSSSSVPVSDTKTVDSDAFTSSLVPLQLPTAYKPLKNEGIWFDRPIGLFPGKHVAAYSFTRPDTDRSFAIVTLLKVDMTHIQISAVAGTKEPAAIIGNPGPGVVPQSVIDSNKLVAAFDGGFQYRDGKYGMIVGDKTYLPLQNNLGTIVGYKDGTYKILNYTGQDLGSNTTFVRQNCPILVDGGNVAVNDIANKALWGRTPSTAIFTWRSGIGQDKNGNLIFAVGNNLTPETLAIALKTAGAVEAIQLDINPNWVRFNLFKSTGPGAYSSTTLTHDLKDGSDSYLHGYVKDFFYLFGK